MRQALVDALRSRGVNVRTATETAMIEREDEVHLRYATTEGYTLYSFNVGDYLRLHGEYLAKGVTHNGIVLARQQQYSVGEQLRRLLKLIAAVPAEEMTNRVEFLSAWG